MNNFKVNKDLAIALVLCFVFMAGIFWAVKFTNLSSLGARSNLAMVSESNKPQDKWSLITQCLVTFLDCTKNAEENYRICVETRNQESPQVASVTTGLAQFVPVDDVPNMPTPTCETNRTDHLQVCSVFFDSCVRAILYPEK